MAGVEGVETVFDDGRQRRRRPLASALAASAIAATTRPRHSLVAASVVVFLFVSILRHVIM